MPTLVNDFLAQRRIAVVDVSRHAAGHGANVVYKRLRDRGYSVYAVNPKAETAEDDPQLPEPGSDPGQC